MRKIERLGRRCKTKQSYEVEIIEYFDDFNCTIRFNDINNTILYNRSLRNIVSGSVKNPNHVTFSSTGFIGIGKYKIMNNNVETIYGKVWKGMLQRCYNKKEYKRHPTYKDVTVCEEWHNFQNFAKWYEENYNPETMQGWHLDKDILLKGNKIYSPETCCLVPIEINNLFVKANITRGKYPIGVYKLRGRYMSSLTANKERLHLGSYGTIEEAFQAYKTAKEAYIKEVADKWRAYITDEVYQALINYQVEITD